MSRKWSISLYLIFSIIGAVLLVTASILSFSKEASITLSDRIFVGGLFILSCILGISLALKPNWIKRLSSKDASVSNGNPMNEKINNRRRGHHPLCSRFQNHTISHNGKILCAGCLGLAIGCVIAILLMTLFLIIVYFLSLTFFVLSLSIGLIIITFSYIETALPQRTPTGHVMSNVLLVIGLFLVVSGVFGITKSPLIGAFAVLISFLWLDTRVQLSNWNHEKMCRECRNTCKAY